MVYQVLQDGHYKILFYSLTFILQDLQQEVGGLKEEKETTNIRLVAEEKNNKVTEKQIQMRDLLYKEFGYRKTVLRYCKIRHLLKLIFYVHLRIYIYLPTSVELSL